MATQFIEGLEKMEVSTLMQAGNILFFRPEISNIRKVASQIDACHTKQWIDILNSLQVGEAILRGHYYLNDSEKNLSLPIKVKVEKEYPILKENTNRE